MNPNPGISEEIRKNLETWEREGKAKIYGHEKERIVRENEVRRMLLESTTLNRTLLEENKRQSFTIRNLQKHLSESEQECGRLTEENERITKERDEARSEVKALEQIDERNRGLLRSTRSMTDDRDRKIQQLREELEQVKKQRDAARENSINFINTSIDRSNALHLANAQVKSLRSQLADEDKK